MCKLKGVKDYNQFIDVYKNTDVVITSSSSYKHKLHPAQLFPLSFVGQQNINRHKNKVSNASWLIQGQTFFSFR